MSDTTCFTLVYLYRLPMTGEKCYVTLLIIIRLANLGVTESRKTLKMFVIYVIVTIRTF